MPRSLRDQLARIEGKPLLALAREAVWRTRRDWNKARMFTRLKEQPCPVTFTNVPYYSPVLENVNEKMRNHVLGFADEICRGRYPFLGYGTVELGFPPRWNVDFVSGLDWPQIPSDNPSSIRNDGSDVKAPYELSRLQFLPVLGKAYVLSGQERYREAAKELLANWIQENPVGVGINWTLAMEAALRGMSICFLLNLLWPLRPDENGWLHAVTRSLWEHVAYIEAHNEFSHLVRSNHYLSNILGLYCLSLFLEGKPVRAKTRIYRRLIEKEILHQVYRDGGDFEASTGYHVLVTQMFTSALLLMRASRIEPEPFFVQRLRSMYRVIAELANLDGTLPHVGDCDDGRVELLAGDLGQMALPVQKRDSLRVPGLLGLGSALFGEMGGAPDDACWYGLGNGSATRSTGSKPSFGTYVFRDSGMAVVGRSEASVLFFAMPNGIQGRGSHTHNDKLSVILRIDGQDLLSDCGTYCYTRDADGRNLYRSTAAHNTVVVDGQEQNLFSREPRKMFAIANDANVSPIELEQSRAITSLRASHTGYSRIGIIHTRTVRCLEKKEIEVEDELRGSGLHNVEVNFHLDPAWRVVAIQPIGTTVVCRLEGLKSVEMTLSAPLPLQADVVESMMSRTFGSRFPASKIRVVSEAQLPFTLKTRITWN